MNANWKADSKPLVARCQTQDRPRRGFTLTELLVVLATLAILAALMLPALAGTQPRSKAFQCLNNMRQLALAWTLYASENNERLAINSDPAEHNGSAFFPTPNGSSPSWVIGVLSWGIAPANTNTAYLVNDADSLLGGYLCRNYEVFACPAAAYFLSPFQRSIGDWDHRVRTVSMDAAVGAGYKYPVANFGWDPAQWYVAVKTTDLNNPGPSQTFIFSDEHPDSIDDEVMYTPSYPATTLAELPGNQHEGAAGVTFADGHVEMHKWTGAVLPNRPVEYAVQQRLACSATDPDMVWLAQHTPQAQ
ncbi:MAG: prepilin-type N-terminal cleavage/methylation domain-containing protein [Limisphaerales bacterium]